MNDIFHFVQIFFIYINIYFYHMYIFSFLLLFKSFYVILCNDYLFHLLAAISKSKEVYLLLIILSILTF